QFTHFVFVEADPANLEALKARTEPLLKGRHAKYILGDVNAVLQDITTTVPQKGALSLIFADPYTIQLKMQTIQWLSGHLRVDWLIHFPYGTHLQRVLPQTQTEMTKDTQTALDEFFGGKDWRKLRARRPNPRSYLDLYEGKLLELEYMIGDNYPRITNSKNSTLYYLVLASKSELALKFWKSVNEIGPEGQRTLF
ncbi:MAG: three-Cys-motif partner protein TcmP, partial [Actinomycetota bacterium]|nr:three-Cys-motif partner protein TcmP [Actinomycetota bacterium]